MLWYASQHSLSCDTLQAKLSSAEGKLTTAQHRSSALDVEVQSLQGQLTEAKAATAHAQGEQHHAPLRYNSLGCEFHHRKRKQTLKP